MSALNGKTLQALFVFEGYCNREVFQLYIDCVLVPILKPGQTVIMDNAPFHKSKKVKEDIEKAQCILLYLPADSPDFNPIEHYWHALKNTMRKCLDQKNYDLYSAAHYAFNNVHL